MAICNGCIITCEHGGNRVPARFQSHFKGHAALLETHRGYDPGALELARSLAGALGAPILYSTTTRLLIELNRSLGHPQLFSECVEALGPEERDWLIQNYYMPYQRRVEKAIESIHARNRRVLHLSVHSFTPVLHKQKRNADIGLLYDPRREREKAFCKRWADALRSEWPAYRVRMNYPYAGRANSLATLFRRRFPLKAYSGIELQFNQKFVENADYDWSALKTTLVNSLIATIGAAPI